MAQMKVFVSHSHQNNAFCAELVKTLTGAGVDVWYDDESLHTGRLGPIIERELRDRPVFIVVLSPAALASQWVEDETRWAYKLYRREPARIILPVLAEALPSEDAIWLFLQDFKRVEASGCGSLPTAQAIAQTLRALTLTPAGAAPTPTTPQPAERLDVLVTKGNAYLAQQEHSKALLFFVRATEWYPGHRMAWFSLSACHYELGDTYRALHDCEQAIAIDPHWAWAWSFKVELLVKMGRLEDALVAVDQQIELEGNDPILLLMRGDRLSDLNRYDEALVAYEHAVDLDPTSGAAWFCVSETLRALGRAREADDAYANAEVFGWPT